MKLRSVIACVFLAGSPALLAQNTALQFTAPPAGAGCPVALRAQHLADGTMVKTRDAHPPGVGQWLHLTFTIPGEKQIEQVTITVHGPSDRAHVTQALAASNASADTDRTLTLSWGPQPGREVSKDVWVPGITAVESIDLDGVSFSDGSGWRASGSQACRVAPDPLMLITSR